MLGRILLLGRFACGAGVALARAGSGLLETRYVSGSPILTVELLAYFNPGGSGRLYNEFLDRAILIYWIEQFSRCYNSDS